jgi:hypothetical protein
MNERKVEKKHTQCVFCVGREERVGIGRKRREENYPLFRK